MLWRLFIAALWSPAGKKADLLLVIFIVLCDFLMWYPGSGVVLDCIISCSLPSFLLCKCMLNYSANFVKPDTLDIKRNLLGILSISLQVCSLFSQAILTQLFIFVAIQKMQRHDDLIKTHVMR